MEKLLELQQEIELLQVSLQDDKLQMKDSQKQQKSEFFNFWEIKTITNK